MAYTVVPIDINETFAVSQPKITDNFAAINSVVTVDHVTFDDADQGKHKKVTLTEQAADQTTAVNEMALYTKDAGSEPNLYLRKQNDTTVYNMTPSTAGHSAVGYEVLPSGLIMKWGSASILDGSVTSGAITFNPGKAFATVYSITVTPYGARNGAGTGVAQDYVLSMFNADTTKFYVTRNNDYKGSTVTFKYFAVGV